jgi:hypothetical protein
LEVIKISEPSRPTAPWQHQQLFTKDREIPVDVQHLGVESQLLGKHEHFKSDLLKVKVHAHDIAYCFEEIVEALFRC